MQRTSIELYQTCIVTPLGVMIALYDATHLYFLDFVDEERTDKKLQQFLQKIDATIISDGSRVSALVEKLTHELALYFKGMLKQFNVPFFLVGTSFQQAVWRQLLQVPYGSTKTYGQQAVVFQKPNAFRAVANANGANNLAIIIPCHRIIKSNGELGGYAGGIARKKWLIKCEKQHAQSILMSHNSALLCYKKITR